MVKRALVLGAGGHAAAAWEIGVLVGLADEHVAARNADVLVGTSAGARIAVALANGRTLNDLHDEQLAPDTGLERVPPEAVGPWRAAYAKARGGEGTERDVLRRLGRLDDEVAAAREPRRSLLAATISRDVWPDRDVRLVTVDAERGERVVLHSASRVSLLDALEASGAMPGLFPLVPAGSRLLMDGSTYSIDNADIAADCEEALVLTLRERRPPMGVVSLEDNVGKMRASGTSVEAVLPDEAAETALDFVQGDVLDPTVRRGALLAGRAQGRALAARVATWWKAGEGRLEGGSARESSPPGRAVAR